MIKENLNENLSLLKELFKNAMDYTARELKVGSGSAALLSLDGLINKQQTSISIINPILSAPVIELTGNEQMEFLSERVLATVDKVKIYKISDITEKLFLGFSVLLLDGCGYALAFGVQGFEKRSVSEPENEIMQQGSKEGFVEAFLINLSMIRRRMRNTELKFEMLTVGSESKTPLVL